MTPQLDTRQYMEDSKGRMVPIALVSEIDRERDALIKELVSKAKEIQRLMAEYKARTMGDVKAFADLSAEKYEVKLGGRKGNITLVSFDGRQKVQVAISEHISFDERLKAAKALIDECLTTWTADSRDELKTIVLDAFQVDKEGRLNVSRILNLRRLAIDDPKWQRAMQAIGDSIQVVGSKSYLRLYEREYSDARWEPITLDMAGL